MKIDLVGSERRGLAMGFNEFAGYFSVAISALATGYVAGQYGLRPQSFYLGVAYVFIGLLMSALMVHETKGHVAHEVKLSSANKNHLATVLSQKEIFVRTTLKDKDLSSVIQAGFVNNLNDGMTWGLFPIFFASHGLSLEKIGWLAAIGDVAHPSWRASSVGIYRLWRDSGYAIGAIISGLVADFFGISAAIGLVALITFLSGVVVKIRMTETLKFH